MANYDVIVVGGGHAGIEASLPAPASGTLPFSLLKKSNRSVTCLATLPSVVGQRSSGQGNRCLGGEMAKATDETGIQFRQLNTGKGPAVRSSRAQSTVRNTDLE